jgi:hypothetical protein
MDEFEAILAARDREMQALNNYIPPETEFEDLPPTEYHLVTPALYDKVAYRNWDMDPVDRSLDPAKVRPYLDQLELQDRQFVGQLLSHTKYIRFPQFKQSLKRAFNLFSGSFGQKPFHLLLPTDKIGSEHWLTALLWPEIRKMNLLDIVPPDYPFEMDK